MAETQIELTPEEESRLRWENLLLGKAQAVVESISVIDEPNEEIPPALETIEVVEDSPEAILSQLYKSMLKP